MPLIIQFSLEYVPSSTLPRTRKAPTYRAALHAWRVGRFHPSADRWARRDDDSRQPRSVAPSLPSGPSKTNGDGPTDGPVASCRVVPPTLHFNAHARIYPTRTPRPSAPTTAYTSPSLLPQSHATPTEIPSQNLASQIDRHPSRRA